jgi:hypothetical protein
LRAITAFAAVRIVLGGPVVLLEQDGRGIGVVALELLDVADGRSAERIDRLVGIADDNELPRGELRSARAHQLLDEDVLRVVGVLVLVHEDVPESTAVVLRHVREELEDGHGRGDEVVEVEGVRAAQPALVVAVGLGEGLLGGVHRAAAEVLEVDELVLQVRHLRQERPGRVLLRIEVEVADDHGHEAQGVGLVVDREGAGHAKASRLAAEDAHAGAVERGHPHGPGPGTDQLCHTLLHLAGGLVRERDRQHLAGLGVAGRQQVGDAAREHPGLAGSGTGDDEQGAATVLDGQALRRVEVLDEAGQPRIGAVPGVQAQLLSGGVHHPSILGTCPDSTRAAVARAGAASGGCTPRG